MDKTNSKVISIVLPLHDNKATCLLVRPFSGKYPNETGYNINKFIKVANTPSKI